MAIQFICPNGHELSAPDERAGKPGKCPKCQIEFLIPELEEEETEGEQGKAANRPGETIVFLCPNGHKLNGPASLKGKPGQCPHCGARFRIPADDDEDEAETGAPSPVAAETQAASASPSSVAAGKGPPAFSADFLSPPTQPQAVAEEFPDAIEVVDVVEQPEEELSLADQVVELGQSGLDAAEHPLHQLLSWLCQQRQEHQPILVRLQDGEVLQIDQFAPDLSRAGFAVFSSREANDRHSLIAIAWDAIARVELHKVRSLPENTFLP